MSQAARTPPPPGIRQSRMATSGCSRAATAMASSASAATPATSNPGSAASRSARLCRTLSSSSATSTRVTTRVPAGTISSTCSYIGCLPQELNGSGSGPGGQDDDGRDGCEGPGEPAGEEGAVHADSIDREAERGDGRKG